MSSGGAFALFVPWVTDRALRDFPCLPVDSGGPPACPSSALQPHTVPPLADPGTCTPKYSSRTVQLDVSPLPQALAVQSYWQALHRFVNQPTATGDWVAEKDCHLANCSGHAPLYSVCWFISIDSIEWFWYGCAFVIFGYVYRVRVKFTKQMFLREASHFKRSHPTWRPRLQRLQAAISVIVWDQVLSAGIREDIF